jgi:hypothetical protein
MHGPGAEKNKTVRLRAVIVVVVLLAVSGGPTLVASEKVPKDRLSFWSIQRRGANFFNEVETRERFRAAREAGLEWVRLVPDKWKGARRDFLIGDAGEFQGLVPEDLAHLEEVLGWAEAEGMPVVIGMLSLPGCRWVQLNGDRQDYRLWNEGRYQQQAAAFWKELASRLTGHPAVVAYNPLNEPHPEREAGHDGAEVPGFPAWLEAHRGTTADLDLFYGRIVAAIREVDPETPILVEGYGHGSVAGLTHLSPIDDPAILYSFHFYDPWQYTARKANRGRYAYPDRMPQYWDGPAEGWERDALASTSRTLSRPSTIGAGTGRSTRSARTPGTGWTTRSGQAGWAPRTGKRSSGERTRNALGRTTHSGGSCKMDSKLDAKTIGASPASGRPGARRVCECGRNVIV